MTRLEQTIIKNIKRACFDEMTRDNANRFFVFPQKGCFFANATLNLLDRDFFENKRPVIQHSFFRDEHCQQSGYFEDRDNLMDELFQEGTIIPDGPENYRIAPLHVSERQAGAPALAFYITPKGFLSYAKRPAHIDDAVRVFVPVFFSPCKKVALFASKRKNDMYNIIAVLNGREVMLDQGILDELAAS